VKLPVQRVLQQLRDLAIRRGVTFMDVRANEYENTSAMRQDGKADKLNHAKTSGLGIRVLADGAWGFATTNETTLEAGKECLDAALTMARASSVRATAAGVAFTGVELSSPNKDKMLVAVD